MSAVGAEIVYRELTALGKSGRGCWPLCLRSTGVFLWGLRCFLGVLRRCSVSMQVFESFDTLSVVSEILH